MEEGQVAKILEHFPRIFEELDQLCAQSLGVNMETYFELQDSIKTRIETGNWPDGKYLDMGPGTCYHFMELLMEIDFEERSDCWVDLSYPDEPIGFCAFEITGEQIRNFYLRNVIDLTQNLKRSEECTISQEKRKT